MSVAEELEAARDDLEALLVGVLGSLLGADEVGPSWPGLLPDAPGVACRLALHDLHDDSFAAVEIRAGTHLTRLIVARTTALTDPIPQDLLEVLSTLGDIVAGGLMALTTRSCRSSLPVAEAYDVWDDARTQDRGVVRVGACVVGHLVELAVRPVERDRLGPDIQWPGSRDDLVETQR